MTRLARRLAIYVGTLLALVATYTAAYRWGMAALEGEPRTWYGALEIVVQSMTTTGYGQDAPWTTPQMTVLMVMIQLTGIAYIFVAFPLFVVPWLETIVQPTAPEDVGDVTDHVVIVGYTELCASLVDELASRGTPYLVLEPDDETARDLYDDGVAVLHADPTTDDALESARIADARAIVVDATEGEYISTILAIAEHNPDATLLALIEEQSRARYLRYAGVDEVLSPKHRLGKALGDRVRGVVDVELDGEDVLGDALHVTEHPIDRDSEFFDVPLESCLRLEETGVAVLGAWVRGDFVTTMSADVHTDENTTLLVAGTEAQIDAVAARVGSSGRPYRSTTDPVLVIGSGIVGSTVVGGLQRAGLETVLVERERVPGRDGASASANAIENADGGPGVETDGSSMTVDDRGIEDVPSEADVVGDPTTEETFHEAGIEDVRTVVIALDNDDDAILAALVAQELNPDAQIFAALRRTVNVSRLRATGVDYVLALPNVAGRMVTRNIFEGDVMTFDEHLDLVRVNASPLAGERVDPVAIRDRTGCAVVALERDGEFRTDVDEWVVERDDFLLVAGDEAQLEELRERLGDG